MNTRLARERNQSSLESAAIALLRQFPILLLFFEHGNNGVPEVSSTRPMQRATCVLASVEFLISRYSEARAAAETVLDCL
ncbi:MAG: hypothetical protein IT425_01945 [Pirellulales bacterium]|nr:hypothetical protein [Pirellulales bacterium]